MIRTASLAACLAAGLALALPSPVAVAALDWKTMHGSNCVAGGTSTTANEISVGAYGVGNPGSSDELVVCPLPIDADAAWSGATPTTLQVRFRPGSVAGRISCTVYSGTAGAQDAPITTSTVTSAMVAANGPMTSIDLTVPDPAFAGTPPAPPVALTCVIGPKVKLGGVFLAERVATYTP
jgi:hypothetical protein